FIDRAICVKTCIGFLYEVTPISEARLSGSKSLRLAFFFSPNIGNGQGLCYKKRMFAFFLHRYSANG
ncbi:MULTISPECIES: hypothetical protein, partial [Bacteroides]|uniref:hypothetical protein n=1 Tax=Bacteroides TaxID=816 RepID=UPI001E309E2B